MRTIALLITLGAFGFAVAGLAGAASTATVTAQDYRFVGPAGPIASGDAVTFSYPTGASIHDVHFSGPSPASCSGSTGQVGSAPGAAAPGWSATCTFTAPGTYAFFCDIHPGMTGTIAVTGPSAPLDAPPPPPSAMTPQSPPPPPPSAMTPPPPPPAGTPPPSHTSAPSTAPRPKAPVASGLTVAANQRGGVVRGGVTISAAGSRVVAKLLARANPKVQLGELRLARVRAGRLSFAVGLGPRGRRALAAGPLRLTLSLTVDATTIARPVTLRR